MRKHVLAIPKPRFDVSFGSVFPSGIRLSSYVSDKGGAPHERRGPIGSDADEQGTDERIRLAHAR